MIRGVTVVAALIMCLVAVAQRKEIVPRTTAPITPSEVKAQAFKVVGRAMELTDLTMRHTIAQPSRQVQVVDFGASCPNEPGVAYGLSTIQVEQSGNYTFQIDGSEEIKVWIDQRLIYQQPTGSFRPLLDEEGYYARNTLEIPLTAGNHKILIKSTRPENGRWMVVLQSPSMRPNLDGRAQMNFTIEQYAPQLSQQSRWLVIGTFDGDIETIFEPEREIDISAQYSSSKRRIAWNTPRGNMTTSYTNNPLPWSAHSGIFIWALQRLSDETGQSSYEQFAHRWCAHMALREPIVIHQVFDLNDFECDDFGLSGRSALRYTAAPALPYLTRLARAGTIEDRPTYQRKADQTIDYLSHIQMRVKGLFARSSTPKPTLWSEDIFYGIVPMVYAAQCSAPTERDSMINAATTMLFDYTRSLRNPTTGLYRYATEALGTTTDPTPYQGRANALAMWATAELLNNITYKDRNYIRIRELLRSQIDAAMKYQDANGHWLNIINQPTSYREPSATMLHTLVMAQAINRGWISRTKYAGAMVKGWEATQTLIDPQGNIAPIAPEAPYSSAMLDFAEPATPNSFANSAQGVGFYTMLAVEMMKFAYGCQGCY